MGKKYELLKNDTVTTLDGRTLYRIRALRDLGPFKAGDVGGYIECEANLSHFGLCWVADNAWIYGRARVIDNGCAFGHAQIFGDALVAEKGCVGESAQVFGCAEITGHASVSGRASISGRIVVSDFARVYGNVRLNGFGRVDGETQAFKSTWLERIRFAYRSLTDAWRSFLMTPRATA